jgi:hypothetical protein
MLVISDSKRESETRHMPLGSDGLEDLSERKNEQIQQARNGNARNAFGALLVLSTIKGSFSILIRSCYHIAATKQNALSFFRAENAIQSRGTRFITLAMDLRDTETEREAALLAATTGRHASCRRMRVLNCL